MEKIIMLGTGSATVKNCYNTCFVLNCDDEYLLVDAGGGNGILKQLDLATIPLSKIKNMIVTHSHSDHVLGVVWIFRMIATMIINGQYEGNFYIYCHNEVANTIKTMVSLTLQKKLCSLLDKRIFIVVVNDGQCFDIVKRKITFFDIHSTKIKQFGFSMQLKAGKLTCLGDEPYNELCYSYAFNAKWLLCEAFCLYSQRDIFKPYEKHHSTVKDASLTATKLAVENLLLYHSEEMNLANRKQLYYQEASQYFTGNIYIPDDLEEYLL